MLAWLGWAVASRSPRADSLEKLENLLVNFAGINGLWGGTEAQALCFWRLPPRYSSHLAANVCVCVCVYRRPLMVLLFSASSISTFKLI